MSIKKSSTQLAANSNTPVLHFNFSKYEDVLNKVCHNNAEVVDFVTANGSLYVCAVDGTKPTNADINEQDGFLLIIKHGEDGSKGEQGVPGIPGVSPNISVRFNGRVLQILEDGTVVASSADLTGPAWRPVLNGTKLSWERSRDFDRTPQSIDLEELRPIDAKPLLLRVDSDNTKRADEVSGPARFIQWKHEGDKEWTNLIAINELMNLALAGVSFWQDENDHKWHFGHRQVIQAEYTSDSKGQQIISHVELGDIFYDAGPIDIANTEIDVQNILNRLTVIEDELRNIPSLNGYATEEWVNNQGFLKTVPTVDAYTKQQSDAKYQSKGNYLTEHQSLKTINGNSLVGTGDITISVGETSLFDVRFDVSSHKLQKTVDGQNWTDLVDLDDYTGGTGGGMTESEVKHLIGQVLEGVLDSAIPEYVKGSDHNYFIRLNDLANYTTVDDVAAMIRDAMTGQNVDYYRVFTLYQRTNSPTTAPAKPVVGVWEWNTAANVDAIALKPNNSSAWSNHPENATTSTPYLWMTSATYSYLTKSEVGQDPWETPICLTAEPGEDGADGDSVEFIYILCTDAEFNNIKNTTPVAEHGDNRPDDLPVYTTPSGNGWTDRPSGISETYPIEAVTIRTKDNGTWSAYRNPTIWSMWGEDGMDGDGVEYIFFTASGDLVNIDQVSGKVSLPTAVYYSPNSQNFIPTEQSMVTDLGQSYQVPDWIQVADNNWTDNPSDVDEGQPFEFVSIRKYHDGTGWGPFCTPRLWSHYGGITVTPTEIRYGETSYRPYTCYAFCRTNTDISNYTVEYDFSEFATVEHPNPTYLDLTDNQKIQFYENPQDYTKTLNTNNQDAHITWSDTVPVGTTQLWLITAHIGDENQVSDTGWTSPVKWGDQAGINVEYSADIKAATVYANPSLWNSNHLTFNDFQGTDEQREAQWEAAVRNTYGVWSDSVQSPVYMATTVLQSNGVWSDWVIAKIKGEKGTRGDTGPQGPSGSNGADGSGLEFVYYRTASENEIPGTHPTLGTYDPESSATRTEVSEDPDLDDFFPKAIASGFTLVDGTYWHDHPQGVTEQLPCEWVAIRHSSPNVVVEGNVQVKHQNWGNYNVALWSKYGANGRDGDGIEYVFWGLSEQDVQQLTSTWPTQQVSNNNTNHGQNVDPTRKDTANRSVTDPEYLPTILINNTKRQAVDDNPGIENNKYVFASMRKYNGTTHTWGEFGEIKLWNEQNNQELYSVVLDIEDDTHPVYVDENGRILDRYMDYTGYSTDGMYLYKDLILLNCGNVSIKGDNGDVTIATLNNGGQSNNYDKVTITSPGIPVTSNGITAHVYPYWAWKYEDSNHSTVQLRVVFDKVSGQNPALNDSFDITIKVQSADGQYVGSDILRLVPKYSDKEVELLRVPGTQRTSEEGGTTYSDSEFMFYGWYGDSYTPLALLEQTRFYFKYDDQVNWTEFYIPSNNSNLVNLRNNVDGVTEGGYHFYFDRTGSVLSSATGAFYEIWLYNRDLVDNIHGQWTNWSMQAYVKAAAFTATNDYPVDELYFGIGFDGNEPIDEANVHIIYPGKNGQPGTNGSYKKELYRRGTENSAEGSWVATWSSTGATIATLTTAGWSATKPSTTSSYPHIWMTRADVTIGQEGTQVCVWETPTRITPVDGNVTHTYEYLAGTIMRTSEWSAGTTGTTKYWDGNTVVSTSGGVETQSSTNEGIKYLDVVSVTTTTNGVTKTSWYKCITNHTKTSTSPATDSTNWAEFAIMGDAAFHNLLVENAAYIESLTSKQVVITDNNTIVAGMASGADIASASGNQTVGDVRIWAGTPTTNGDLTTAPFTVDDDGAVKASNINLAGGSISGTLDIGGDGKIRSRLTESGHTHQTVIDAEGFSNSYRTTTQGYGNEVSIKDGTVVVEEGTQASDYVNQATLWSNALGFKNVTGGTTTYTQAVTTITKIDNVNQMPILSIECVTALPQDPSASTLYIII